MWDLHGDARTMRAPTLRLMLGTSILFAGCTIDARDNQPAETGSAGPTQGTTDAVGSTGDSTTGIPTGVSDETTGGASSSDDGSTGGGPLLDVAPEDTDGVEIAEVFGHSGRTLYRLDPETLGVEEVGDFTNCGTQSVVDLALDEDSNMFGVRYGALYSIDRVTAECTLIANGEYPDSLSFVPRGTVLADREALVGFVNERYVRIDTETGEHVPVFTGQPD